ncbi:hypothetical protein BCS42_03795 [Crenothrix sp. D3]|nr:hypothetical protein BCS42_03795 [Crenothrix sp. D3]
MNHKAIGSFYTPKDIALWVSQRSLSSAFLNTPKNELIHILEPSCGDGSFLKAINELSAYKEHINIDAVEYESVAIEKARHQHSNVNFYHEDFLFWKNEKRYDVILGNPPYIVRKVLNRDQFIQCKNIHIMAELQDREIANIWTAFVVKCSEILSDKGILAFVLPTELLQVNYAKEIRNYLSAKFKRIEVISFRNLTFKSIAQDTVILIAYKLHKEEGLYFSEATSVNELTENLSFDIHHGDNDSKWSSYILKEDEIRFIKEIAQKCSKVSDLCSSVAGIVTAANDYFIVSQKIVDKYELHSFVKPIIQKGMFVNGSAELSKKDYNNLKKADKPCYILDLNNILESDFTDELKSYLKIGEEKDIPQRYKCKIRTRWFDIPSIWKSEGFFFKRGHHYPKLLVNKADVYVTDSAYRIKMKDGMSMENFTMSFYNSLTLLFAELNGRYYGGGVLELTPNEFKGLPIPKYVAQPNDYKKFIKIFNKKNSIEEFLLDNDRRILSSIGISEADITNIHNLYTKVKSRRLRSNK